MNIKFAKTAAAAVALTAALSLTACKVNKTQEGEMPAVDVDVQAQGGQLPEYNVETPEVKMGTETRTVEVPTATIEMPDDPDSKVTDEVDSSKH